MSQQQQPLLGWARALTLVDTGSRSPATKEVASEPETPAVIKPGKGLRAGKRALRAVLREQVG